MQNAATTQQTEANKMVRLSYSKHFLTGTLAGLSVRCGFNVPASEAHKRSLELQAVNVLHPGKDCITKAEYYIYNVGSEEVA